MLKVISLCSVVMALSACSTVEPWERGTLAKDVMAWQPDSLKASLDSHISFSKAVSYTHLTLPTTPYV